MDTEILTSVLRKNGYLENTTVLDVELAPKETNGIASEFSTAELRYSSNDHLLPCRMIIKKPLVGDRGQSEADFYELMLGKGEGLPLMRYFGMLDEDLV
jgi:hypothetical protein